MQSSAVKAMAVPALAAAAFRRGEQPAPEPVAVRPSAPSTADAPACGSPLERPFSGEAHSDSVPSEWSLRAAAIPRTAGPASAHAIDTWVQTAEAAQWPSRRRSRCRSIRGTLTVPAHPQWNPAAAPARVLVARRSVPSECATAPGALCLSGECVERTRVARRHQPEQLLPCRQPAADFGQSPLRDRGTRLGQSGSAARSRRWVWESGLA